MDTLLKEEKTIAIIAVIVVFFLLLISFINSYLPFKEEKDYIKTEMARCCDEEEYLHWKSKLNNLYLICIKYFYVL